MKIAFAGKLLFLALLPFPALSQDSLTRKLDEYLTQASKLYQFNGSVLIARGDNILLAKGYGRRDVQHGSTNSPQTVFQRGSLTKPFTSHYSHPAR